MSDQQENDDFPLSKRQKLNSEPNSSQPESVSSVIEDDATKEMEIDFAEDSTEMGTQFQISDEKCNNYVTMEELQKLREFKVLDEVKSNDEDSDAPESDSNSDENSEGLPDEEIEKMLEEDLPEDFKAVPKPKKKTYITREKTFLEEKGVNNFEVLPLDWITVRHCSGMPIYMDRTTRVCTLSKPYFIGKLSFRKHEIPLSAIPCLAYKKALEEEEKQKVIDKQIQDQIEALNGADKQTETNKTSQNVNLENSNDKLNSVDEVSEEISKKDADNNELDANHALINEVNNVDIQNSSNDEQINEISEINNEIHVANTGDRLENEISSDFNEMKCPFQPDRQIDGDSISNENVANITSNTKRNNEKGDQPNVYKSKPLVLPGGIVVPPPKVETVTIRHLAHEELTEYCKRLFKFKTVNLMHFKRWADRRKYTKVRKILQHPNLPEGTKVITLPAQTNGQENGTKAMKRDWVMNMNGRSYLSVFHEYVRRAFQTQPVYEFKQLENSSCPYQATVHISGMQYGVGQGSSKRQAKSSAARASILILIPEMKDELDAAQDHTPNNDEPDFTFFDNIGIEDPRVLEFCAATCEPSPHAILRTCLLRNFGAGDRHIRTEMKKLEYQKIELTMTVGKHTATVVCKNKKLAKQRASQAILQALHPHVHCWGSLLRLYGSRSVKSCKEKKLEEQQITLLQDKARHNEPNYAVLEKLRNEMRKLREMDEALVPIGTLLVSHDLPTHSGSNLNNVDL